MRKTRTAISPRLATRIFEKGGTGRVFSRTVSLPDQLTVARIAAVPIVVLLFAWDFPNHAYWATAVFVVAMATDQIDGWLARRRGISSALGKLLDPVADKVLVLAALVMLVGEGVAPAWMIALIVVREILVSGLRLAAVERGVVLGSSGPGQGEDVGAGARGSHRRARSRRSVERRRRLVGAPPRARRDLGVRARLRPCRAARAARRERVGVLALAPLDRFAQRGAAPCRLVAVSVRRADARLLEHGRERPRLRRSHPRNDDDLHPREPIAGVVTA